MLLGQLPPDFIDDARMVWYVVFSMCVLFFLMLNFLLAIVVEVPKPQSLRFGTEDTGFTVLGMSIDSGPGLRVEGW